MLIIVVQQSTVSLPSDECFFFFFFLLLLFLLVLRNVSTLSAPCLPTDSSFIAPFARLLRVVKGYGGARAEKWAAVAGHRGSQVDALTKLEVDTRRDPQVGPSCLRVCPFYWRTWS